MDKEFDEYDEVWGAVEVFYCPRSHCWWWHQVFPNHRTGQPFGPFVKREEAERHVAYWHNPERN